MKTTVFMITMLLLLSGCTPKFMDDMSNNQYFEKQVHVDSNAYYIGEWTGAIGPGLLAIKINASGNIKMCGANEYFGTSNGKVFKENGKIKMIFESGSQYEILALEKDHLIVSTYGKEYKYYSDKVPDRCKQIFKEF